MPLHEQYTLTCSNSHALPFFAVSGWSGLLNRGNLQNVNRSLRSNCPTCRAASAVPGSTSCGLYRGRPTTSISLGVGAGVGSVNSCAHELPSVISACLVSMEPQSSFRLFPARGAAELLNSGALGEGGGSGPGGGGSGTGQSGQTYYHYQGGHHTRDHSATTAAAVNGGPGPGGAPIPAPSTTHILVFPTSTSARAQSVSPFVFSYHGSTLLVGNLLYTQQRPHRKMRRRLSFSMTSRRL